MNSKFSIANKLLREGKFCDALQVYEQLVKVGTGFRPYLLNYVLTKRMVTRGLAYSSALPFRDHRTVKHPDSRACEGKSCRKIIVVTPSFNAEKHISQTIESIIKQEGDFFIDYVIKDACSGDRTDQIVGGVQKEILEKKVPLLCNGLSLTWHSAPDKGMYDAVHLGFQERDLISSPEDILTYLNADDIYEPKAFQIAITIFSETKAQWICGQKQTIDEAGEVLHRFHFPLSYAREDIARGWHLSGGNLYFIQQEGSFWKRGLYDRVGGLNREMKLAGDFDLWLKFANETELLAVDRPLASFRSRPGQLSESFFRYRDEIEAHGLPMGQSDSKSHTISKDSFMLVEDRGPAMAKQQSPGPVCFLNDDLSIREVVYMKRAWVKGENV